MSFPAYPLYKESGVEWLGQVPGHWAVRRLKFSARLVTDKATQKENPIALENIERETGRYLPCESEFQGDGTAFQKDDILFGKLRPYLAKALLAKKRGEAVGDFHVLRHEMDVDPKFLHFQVLDKTFIDIVDGSTYGSKMPRASWDFIGSMPLAVPPLDEQELLAEFLIDETAKIDTLIRDQERLNDLLSEKRTAILSSYVFDASMEWRKVRIKELFKLVKRQGHPRLEVLSVYRDHGVVLKNSRSDNFNKTPENLNLYQLVEKGDLVINKMKAWQGSLGISPFRGITSPDYLVFSPVSEESKEFIHYLLRSKEMAALYLTISNGIRTNQWRLEGDKFLASYISLPPLTEQERRVGLIKKSFDEIEQMSSLTATNIDLLRQRRRALITSVVTGKIDVRGFAPSQQ